MNGLDEFAEAALTILVGVTLLIWLLTYLEQGLIWPVTEKRRRRGIADVLSTGDDTPADTDNE
jgi:hypothetical protein